MFKFDEVNRVYREPVSIITAVIGLAGSAYAANKASDAQADAEKAAKEAREKAQAEQRRLAMADKPEELGASVDFGSGKDEKAGSVDDFLTTKSASGAGGLGLGGAGTQTAGLGFA